MQLTKKENQEKNSSYGELDHLKMVVLLIAELRQRKDIVIVGYFEWIPFLIHRILLQIDQAKLWIEDCSMILSNLRWIFIEIRFACNFHNRLYTQICMKRANSAYK